MDKDWEGNEIGMNQVSHKNGTEWDRDYTCMGQKRLGFFSKE